MAEKIYHERRDIGEKTPLPNALDIIKIKGRWAQYYSPTGRIKYLDSGDVEMIDFDELKLMRKLRGPIFLLEEEGQIKLTDEEKNRVHWGPEQENFPYLKKHVSVFGEYEKK